MPKVDVSVASPDQRGALENLMQLYAHDFSEHWSETWKGHLEDDGRFSLYPLDAYWRDDGHVPLLVRVDGRLAGFAMINRTSRTGLPVDHNVAEFFVARRHRRTGVGRAAASEVFRRYRGQWESAVARRNTTARAFWRKVIGEHPLVTGIDELDVQSNSWDGPVFRFAIN